MIQWLQLKKKVDCLKYLKNQPNCLFFFHTAIKTFCWTIMRLKLYWIVCFFICHSTFMFVILLWSLKILRSQCNYVFINDFSLSFLLMYLITDENVPVLTSHDLLTPWCKRCFLFWEAQSSLFWITNLLCSDKKKHLFVRMYHFDEPSCQTASRRSVTFKDWSKKSFVSFAWQSLHMFTFLFII